MKELGYEDRTGMRWSDAQKEMERVHTCNQPDKLPDDYMDIVDIVEKLAEHPIEDSTKT